jgi:hypothetical protein
MAKAISDCETLLANKEAELAALKEEARTLETYDPAVEHGKELDGTLYVFFVRYALWCLKPRTSQGYDWHCIRV